MSIDILKSLTNMLPAFPPMTFNEDNYKEYELAGPGIMRLWDLLWIPQISVTKFFVSKGSVYPNHLHEGKETIYVTSGQLQLCFEDKSITILPGQSFYILPGVVHRAFYPEDTWGVVVVVPAEREYASKQ